MSLFQLGSFVLNSGVESRWQIDCDSLSDEDIQTLAEMIRQLVVPYSAVEGVPRGGLRLARALEPYRSLHGPRAHLIVDDVLTTGGSMERARGAHRGRQGPAGRPGIVGAVVFARGQCPSWIRAVFQMPECFWVKPRTRGAGTRGRGMVVEDLVAGDEK